MNQHRKLGMFALMGLILGSSIGGGIFHATSNIAKAAAAGPALLAWLIVSLGMLCLILSLNNIVQNRPELSGIVEYAEAGFGKFWGLISGWGYWLSGWLGNIAFAALLLSAAGNLVPALHLGNMPSGPLGIDTQNILPTIIISLIMWAFAYLLNRGVESAAFINAVVLLAKLVPLVAVLLAGFLAFNINLFTFAFWHNIAVNLTTGMIENTSIFNQIRSCFMVMIWVFAGVEGASIFSERAKTKKTAAQATALGYAALIILYTFISMMPYGVLSQQQLAGLDEPALAFVLESIVGPWGAVLVNIGLIISLLGAWLSWTMLPVETMQRMGMRKYLPQCFGNVNRHGTPTFTLLVTTICAQIFIFSFLFPDFKVEGMTTYDFAYTLCSSAILLTWLLGALYQIKLSITHHHNTKGLMINTVIGILAAAFQLCMIISAGFVYITLSFAAYIPAFFLYCKARKDAGEKMPFAGNTGVWVAIITSTGISTTLLLFYHVLSL